MRTEQDLKAVFDVAVAEHRAGRVPRAIPMYREVLAERPDLVFVRDNLCQALLANGDYLEGFASYDVRFERPKNAVAKPQLPLPEWTGEDLTGKSLLVWHEQGFGDQIMFARFAVLLAERGVRVSMTAPPPLAGLLSALPVDVVLADGEFQVPRHDYWVMAASIPGRLGISLETLPSAPYLPGLPGGVGIGVVPTGRATPDPNRSLTPEAAGQVAALAQMTSLLPEDTGAVDFAATADIIRGLDVVVSVDTAVAHLAGAMGKRCFVLLPHTPDWRWMRDRADSPWYPSMTLLRQTRPGSWNEPIAALRNLLSA